MHKKHELSGRSPTTLTRLRAFRAMMNAGTVTAAAEQLQITQPALTRHISALEEEMGLRLFNRHRKRLLPTEEAELFLVEVNRITAAVDELPNIVRNIRSLVATRLRIVVTPRLAAGVLTPALAQFAKSSPDVSVSVDMLARSELERWMVREQFDIGLSAHPITHPDVVSQPFFETPAVVALPSRHRLAGRRAVTADDVADERWIAATQGTRIRAETEEIFLRSDFAPAIALAASNTIVASMIVADGGGVMLTDALSVQVIGGNRIVTPIWQPEHKLRFVLLLPRKPRGTAVNTLVGHLRDHITGVIADGKAPGTRLLMS